jgi:acetyl-CoA carboxylase biotin carboxylase subunit
MFNKVLIANRGEIALRIIKSLQELGIRTATIFSAADKNSLHVKLASECYQLEGEPAKVYLDQEQIIAIALRAKVDAIHPGYGFLAENPSFAEKCVKAGIVFIGPDAKVIASMGSKIEARRLMEKAGVPVVPGTTDPISDLDEIKALSKKYGFPVAIKAAAGGGGRGLKVVRKEEELEQSLTSAKREGMSYFGDDAVYLEKYLDEPRHIEIQVMADGFGNVVHLGERECSIQRRHQKLLEESPAVNLDPELRQRMLEAACAGAKYIGYKSAGTIECLVAKDNFYFLETNTRVQVEHPVTEFVTGVDIVKEQISIAAGKPLSFKQSDIVPRGHSIECRINAEDPYRNFLPSPGKITKYIEPSSPWVRVDTACYQGYEVLPFYDSLLAKLIVWGRTREEAITRMQLALNDFVIEGVKTTIPFHLALLEDPLFLKGQVYTTYIESEFKKNFKLSPSSIAPQALVGSALGDSEKSRLPERNFEVNINQRIFNVKVSEIVSSKIDIENIDDKKKNVNVNTEANITSEIKLDKLNNGTQNGHIYASMHGLMKEILVKEGDAVTIGQRLAIFEAMKMESEILSHVNGKVTKIGVKSGETVELSQLLLVLG